MRTLFVAAGGGGDAVGVLLARNVLAPHADQPALISTCAWERLRIDPAPGPRLRTEFQGLATVGSTPAEILATSDTIPPGRSVLPRLAAETTARLFLHDFGGGALGLSRQLFDLVTSVEADSVTVLDVGGDILARGHEPSLLSPLADSLSLAAAMRTSLPVRIAVVGPGVDGELPAEEVIETLSHLGARRAGAVTVADVEPLRRVLAWHPTEATTNVAAAALGLRGAVDMRRGNYPTPVDERSAAVWTLDQPRLDDFPLAHALINTVSLDEAEVVMRREAIDELDYERDRATTRQDGPTIADTPEHLAAASRANGATHITTRRLLETTTGDLAGRENARVDGLGLWSLTDLARSDGTSESRATQ